MGILYPRVSPQGVFSRDIGISRDIPQIPGYLKVSWGRYSAILLDTPRYPQISQDISPDILGYLRISQDIPRCSRILYDILRYLGMSLDIWGYPEMSPDIPTYIGISWDIPKYHKGYPRISRDIPGYPSHFQDIPRYRRISQSALPRCPPRVSPRGVPPGVRVSQARLPSFN